MKQIEELSKVELNTIFKGEAREFTPWLEQNIQKLNSVLGFNICDTETEYSSDATRIDIVGRIEGDEDIRVVIENQFKWSNHDHLGKVITYYASQNALVAVWISENFKKEHIAAIRALNQLDCYIYLVKATGYRVGELFAVDFEVVEKSKEYILSTNKKNSPNPQIKEWWKKFIEGSKEIGNRTPSSYDWMSFSVGIYGVHYNINIRAHFYSIELMFDHSDRIINEERFLFVKDRSMTISEGLADMLVWSKIKELKCNYVRIVRDGKGYQDVDEWDSLSTEILQTFNSFKKEFDPIIETLKKDG